MSGVGGGEHRSLLPMMKKILLLLLACALCLVSPVRATVPSPNAFLQYTLSSSTQALPVTYVFLNKSDLLVLDTRAPAAPVVLTLNSDYSVSGGAGSTGTLNMMPGGANGVLVGDIITIIRNVPLTQNTNFTNTGPLTAAMIGQALDKLTEITQQINVQIGNCLQIPQDEVKNTVLGLAARESTFLAFDANGNVELIPITGAGIVGVYNVATSGPITGGPITSTGTIGFNFGFSGTYTGTNSFVNSVGTSTSIPVTITNAGNSNSLLVVGGGTTGQSKGVEISAGTNTSDYSLLILNPAGSTTVLKLDGVGQLHIPMFYSTAGFLETDSSGNVTIGEPTGAPGGTTLQMQFNSAGVLAGTPGMTWQSGELGNVQSQNNFLAGFLYQNSSIGTAAVAAMSLQNNTSSLNFYLTGSGYTGAAPLTGGPTGTSANIFTNSATAHLAFGTNGIVNIDINPANNQINFGVPATGNVNNTLLLNGSNASGFGTYIQFEANAAIVGKIGNSNAMSQGGSNNQLELDSFGTSMVFYVNSGGTNAATLTSTGWNSTAIGATTPSTATFTTLSATGTSSLSGNLAIGAGSNALYALFVATALPAAANEVGIFDAVTLQAHANGDTEQALYSQPGFNTGTFTGLNMHNTYINTPALTGSGTISQTEQLYIAAAAVTGGGVTVTSHFGIFQAGSDLNALNGSIVAGNISTPSTTVNGVELNNPGSVGPSIFSQAGATGNRWIDFMGSSTTVASFINSSGNFNITTGASLLVALQLTSGQSVLSLSPTGGIGYGVGSGSTIAQATNRTTGVTINTINGQITGQGTSLATQTAVTFTVTDSACHATDFPKVTAVSGAPVTTLFYVSAIAAGSFNVTEYNLSGISADTSVPLIKFSITPGANS